MCKQNYIGSSGGMEVAGVKCIFGRSESKLGVRYVNYLGDGDSKGFECIAELKTYGEEVEISKLECIGHVQKRVGSRLRRLVQKTKGNKLSDGKVLGGRGRLTKFEIDQLQRYYVLAVRRNQGNLFQMKREIWAIYLHEISTDEKPRHEFCPDGPESWCKFKKAILSNTKYTHKNSLPKPMMRAIRHIFQDLTKKALLSRCLHGHTQNPNESFNATIWQRLPKTVFVGSLALDLRVNDAAICFNEGAIAKCNVLERVKIKPGKFMVKALSSIDKQRIIQAETETTEKNKKKRVKRRLLKRKTEDQDLDPEVLEYNPGAF